MLEDWQSMFRPRDPVTGSEWADRDRRVISASSMPGRWDTKNTEYLREIMDSGTDPAVREVWVQSSAQVGKTEALLNVGGYYIKEEPGPMLAIQPTERDCREFSKERLDFLLEGSLADVVPESKSRNKNKEIMKVRFRGPAGPGYLNLRGANAPSGLASMPIRVLLLDEVDRYPASAGEEGDPVNLAKKRLTTFKNSKLFAVSTPKLKHTSRIEKGYLSGDMRVYMVACPHCGHEQRLMWAGVRWNKTAKPEGGYKHDTASARYYCADTDCDLPWSPAQRIEAVRNHGHWVPTNPHGRPGVRSYHLSELYSPFVTMAETAEAHIEAVAEGPESLQVWVNTALGETWEERGTALQPHDLEKRAEPYGPTPECRLVPLDVAVITVGVDVQADRLEYEVLGVGRQGQTWSLEYVVLLGSTDADEVWKQLHKRLQQRYEHPSGVMLQVAAAFIDAGYNSNRVYKFTHDKYDDNVWAGKGYAGAHRPAVGSKSANNEWGAALFTLGVDTLKKQVYARLGLKDPEAPGYCHFPDRDPYRTKYYRGLTSEKALTKYKNGVGFQVWHLPKGRRNEPLDCRNYAWAAYLNLRITDIDALCDELVSDGVPSNDYENRTPPNPGLKDPYGGYGG